MYKFRVCLAAAGLLAVVFLPNVAAAAEKLYFAVPSLNGKAQLGPSEFNFELGYLLVHRNKQNAFGNCRVVFTTENEKDGHWPLAHPEGGFFAAPGDGEGLKLNKPKGYSGAKAANAVSEWAEKNRKKVVEPGDTGAKCG